MQKWTKQTRKFLCAFNIITKTNDKSDTQTGYTEHSSSSSRQIVQFTKLVMNDPFRWPDFHYRIFRVCKQWPQINLLWKIHEMPSSSAISVCWLSFLNIIAVDFRFLSCFLDQLHFSLVNFHTFYWLYSFISIFHLSISHFMKSPSKHCAPLQNHH